MGNKINSHPQKNRKKQTTNKVHTCEPHNSQVKETEPNLIGGLSATNPQHNTSETQTTPSLAIRFSTGVLKTIKVGAVIGVVLAIIGWNFNQCIDDRKQHLTEFVEVVNERRAAQEKELQSIIAIDASVNAFVDYLGQKPITVSEIEKQLDHIASLAVTANADCNTFKELNYKYHTSKEVLHRDLQKPPPVMPTGAAHQCELLARIAAKLDRPDAQKLVFDAKYREDYVALERGTDRSNLKRLENKDYTLSPERASENELIKEVQIRDSNIIRKVWNCL